MRVAVYLAHPGPDSFNRALFDAVTAELRARDVDVLAHDLYAEDFDPALTAAETDTVATSATRSGAVVREHQAEIATVDALVFVHPNWWGMPPAVLTGWIQRVLAPAVAYKLDTADGEPAGLLRARRALVLNTSDTPAEREHTEFGDPLERIWASCVLPYVGVDDVRRVVFRTVTDSDDRTRADWLRRAREAAAELTKLGG
ncbi:NAD(P)H-dependent oxidoreductase [Rhodococcus sp. SGAir0479]|uniref:NAD(P)H-dependent oxidoreductase n=1 Tax=Rhodococcus sp. SGAir0479 TaxID=2567884 RepID=UPI0010CCBFC6|nr:NAD(P)H-dependent oxidoreductase [Rhodococcus sp. SGAir0479]QCQ91110.1 flavodoxin family protein [Rhodococcus sp. SGAir0479]